MSCLQKEDTEEDSREQVKGEALLLRAYAHFDLLNLYGKPYKPESAISDRGIPIATQIDIEQKYEAATVEEVYKQIFADIKEGRELLQVEQQARNVQYRFSKRSAIALEARVQTLPPGLGGCFSIGRRVDSFMSFGKFE